jgi:cyanate lyase
MSRAELTERILQQKLRKGLSWKQLAQAVERSPVWTTAALLGQMAMSAEEAAAAAACLDLSADDVALLQTAPYRGALPVSSTGVPTDPTVYRFYEVLLVYGTTLKELIHEEFGDGIMSAIDFTMDLQRVPDPKGDRVRITLEGKFLPYKKY